MRRSFTLIVLAASLVQASCAAQIASAPPEVRVRALDFDATSAGKARLYVFRPGGRGRTLLPVAIDGVMLGSTTRDSFLMAELLPGTHVVASTTDENVSTVRLEAREGESYFVKLSTRMGRKVTRSALVQVDSIEGREAIARARMLQAIMP